MAKKSYVRGDKFLETGEAFVRFPLGDAKKIDESRRKNDRSISKEIVVLSRKGLLEK